MQPFGTLSPLFMESGLMPTPNEGQFDPTDPFARAAYRQRSAVIPPMGREEGNLGPAMMAAMVPGGAVTKAIAMAPKAAAAALAATGLMASTSQAGEQEFNWADPDKERTARINNFPTTMNNLNREMKAASRARMPSVQAQMDIARKEYEGLLAQRASDRDVAFTNWQEEQASAREAAELKRRQETSWFDAVPGLRAAIPPAAMAASYLGGRYLGRRLPTGKAMTAGAAGGGMEGALSQLVPTEMDVAGLPRGAPAQQAASADLKDPAYWMRVGGATLGGAGFGAYGAFKGSMGRRDALPRIPGSSPQSSPASQPPMMPMPMGRPTQAPAAPQTSGPPTASRLDPHQGLVYDPITNRWIREGFDPRTLEPLRPFGSLAP